MTETTDIIPTAPLLRDRDPARKIRNRNFDLTHYGLTLGLRQTFGGPNYNIDDYINLMLSPSRTHYRVSGFIHGVHILHDFSSITRARAQFHRYRKAITTPHSAKPLAKPQDSR